MSQGAGHSQEQLAERLGVGRSTVVRWERGEMEPQPWLRPKIARAPSLPERVGRIAWSAAWGSVAVTRDGARLGKGAGYSDLKVALLNEAGLIGPQTTIVTTVHPLQIVDEPLPETEYDFSVEVIVTPEEVITCGPPCRPSSLLWEHLSRETITAIPVLTVRADEKHP